MVVRVLSVCLLLGGSTGCVQQAIQPEPVEPAPPAQPDPEPPAIVDATPEPAPAPVIVEAPADEVTATLSDTIAIVLSDRTPAFENVATELGRLLDDYLLYNLADRSLTAPEVFAGIAELQAKAVIAIGLLATREAILRSSVPVVFCQVFNLSAAQDTAVPVRGVASIPPLSDQVAEWKRLNPELKVVGAILGRGHETLLAEAELAAAVHDVTFVYRLVNSDRETLFTFQRMVPELDGFWLFPDNRVLSVDVLRGMLDYASRHDVDIAVFNDALLDMGATLSASTVEADIAATTISVTSRLLDGEVDALPWMTPLNEVRIAPRARAPAALEETQDQRP